MENTLTIPLVKHTTGNSKPNQLLGAGSKFFKLVFTDEIINHLGREVKVNLRLNDANFPCIVIEKFGQIDHGTPSIISGKTLRIPSKLVDEWCDLGDYNVEFGVECIVLTKNN
jgi:hypothetical protein